MRKVKSKSLIAILVLRVTVAFLVLLLAPTWACLVGLGLHAQSGSVQ